jgi:hypothetical protein
VAYSREEFNSYVENDLTQKKSRFPWGPALGIGIPVGGFLIGSMRTKSGGRVWDHFYKGLQHLEGAMPMGFAATFHGSEFMSPLAAPKSFHLSPEDHPELFKSKKFRYYLSEVTGKRVSELKKLGVFEKGVSWNQGSGYLGDLSVTGGPTIGTNVAALSTGPRRKGTALEWFARVSGLDDASFFTNLDEKKGLRPAWMPAGAGGSKGKLAGRYANSVFSWAMGRMNLLLTSPFDLEVMQEFVSKVPLLRKLNLGVKPGTGAQMLWRYTKKAGVALGAYHLLKYGDYLAREHGTPAAVAVGAAVGAGAGLAIGLRAAKGRPGRYALIGAGVGAALGLGPFRHGPISGLAELYAGVQTNRAGVSTGLGFSEGKRKTEDYFPGLTKPTTLVGMAAMGLVLGGAWNWSQKMTLVKELSGKGIPPGSGGAPGKGAVKGVYELADKQIADKAEAIHDSLKAIADKQKGVSKIVTQIRQRMAGTRKGKEFSAAGAGKYAAVGAGIYTAAAVVGSAVAGDYAGAALQTVASVGAAVAYAKKGPTLALAILALPFLRTKESPEELKRVYSGEEQVAVRSGRWWEAGRTPYEGGRAYYRPHRVAMMRSGSHEAALYGSESKYWETDPVLHPLRFLFNPYERENLMWEQGYKYPVSKTPFEDFPVLGPVMAATIGRIIKPPRFQGRNQWLPEELEEGPRGMRETPGDEPIQRVGLRGTISEQFYRLTELAGLPGFALSAVKGKVTGSEGFFEGRRWATASQVSGVQPAYWSLDIGGAALLCIEENAIVQTGRGCIPIRDVVIGDTVTSRNGEMQKVCNISSRPENDLVALKISGLGVELKATTNHVLPVFKGSICHSHNSRKCIPKRAKRCDTCSRRNLSIQAIDCQVGEVAKGDFVEVPLPRDIYGSPIFDLSSAKGWSAVTEKYVYPCASFSYAFAWELLERNQYLSRKELRDLGISDSIAKEVLSEFRNGSSIRRCERWIKVNEDLAYFLGWYTAEGYINNSSVCLALHLKEHDIACSLGEIAHKYFGASYGIYKNGDNGIRLSIPSFGLAAFCSVVAPGTAINKELSTILMNSSLSIRASFLRGYMLGDGFISSNKSKAGISTSSRILASQALLIGLSLGFHGHSTLDYLEEGGGLYPQGGTRKDTIRSYVVWARETVKLLPEFLSGDLQKLPEHGNKYSSFIIGDKAYFQVSDISHIHGQFRVCDLEIENLHYFTAEFITVHNSESVRRYIPNRRSSIEEYNPLSSGLPSWLPGPDSQYFLDFSKADIYGKVKEPWARLPGPGYSQLHPELKGVDPEQYSPYHRYRVLADVAPWSREYGAYNRVMSKYMGEGRLTPEQMLEIQATRKRVLEVKKARDFQPYMYDSDAIQKMTVRVTGELEPGVYTTNAFGEAPIVMAGVNTSELSLASVARQRGSAANAQAAIRQGAAKRVELSDYLRSYIHPGAEVDIFVHKDPSLMMEYSDEGKPQVQAIISAAGRNINRELLERGLAQAAETSVTLDAKMAVGPVERGFGAVWERFTHGAETPMESFTPLAPIAKFVHQRSALEEYQRTEVYGKDVALWQTPVKSFLAPGFSTMAHWAGWRGLPGEVRERYMVEEYFDRLEYMKYKRLESEARARGEGQVAAQYSTQLARTKVGADLYSKWGPLMALSTKEKSYFREFVEAPTAAERREISRIVSPQMREILHAQWGQRAADAARARMEAGAPQEGGDLASINRFYAMQRSSEARQRAIQQSNSEMPVPAPSWIGWDPKAEMEDYKVKTVMEQGLNPVSFGIWGGDLARVARRPWTHPISVAVQGEANEMVSPGALRSSFNIRMGRAGHRPPSAFLSSAGDNDIEVRSPGYDRLNRYAGPRGDDTIMQF